MGTLIYTEKEYPFNADFDYVTKDKDGKDHTHTITVKLTEGQLAKFDVTDKNVAAAVENSNPETIAKNMLTPDQIKELKKNTNNPYQYNTILTNMAGHVMGFISLQRAESGISAMKDSPLMEMYGHMKK